MPNQTSKVIRSSNQAKIEGGIDIVGFSLKTKKVFIFHFRDNILVHETIPFEKLESEKGEMVLLIFHFKDGTNLGFDLPTRLEQDATVIFSFNPDGPGLEKTNFMGMSAKQVLESQCAGWFRLKDTKEPSIGMMFAPRYENPYINYEIVRNANPNHSS